MQERPTLPINGSLVAAVTQSKINCARRPAASAAQPQAGPRLQPQRLVRPQLALDQPKFPAATSAAPQTPTRVNSQPSAHGRR